MSRSRAVPLGLRPTHEAPLPCDEAQFRNDALPNSKWHRLTCTRCVASIVTKVPPDDAQWPLHRCKGAQGRAVAFTHGEAIRNPTVDTPQYGDHLLDRGIAFVVNAAGECTMLGKSYA